MDKFTSLTVFILASNETEILRETVDGVRKNCPDEDLDKIVIVLKNDYCPSYYEAVKYNSGKIEAYIQKSPDVVQCIAEIPHLAEGSHFVIMSGDMEMNPDNIPDFIREAKKHPQRIICAAKWLKESTIEGYGKIHALCSRTMNRFVSILYGADVKDPFSIYQICPVSVYNKLNYDEKDFLYEYTLKALRNGVEYSEVPTHYKKRSEGKSNFNIITLIKVGTKYCLTALKIRFTQKG